MRDFFRPWNTLHFAILYILIFAVQLSLYITARKKQQDRYWIILIVIQILSILLVIYGNYEPPSMWFSLPNNFFSALVAIPVYSIFLFVTLAKRSSTEEMPGAKIWIFLLIGSIVALPFVIAFLLIVN